MTHTPEVGPPALNPGLVDVLLQRSEGIADYMYEQGYAVETLPNEWEKRVGTFDWVQLTYEHLLYDGETLAIYGTRTFDGEQGPFEVAGWYEAEYVQKQDNPRAFSVVPTGPPWSDIVIAQSRGDKKLLIVGASAVKVGKQWQGQVQLSDGTLCTPMGAGRYPSSDEAFAELERVAWLGSGPAIVNHRVVDPEHIRGYTWRH